MDVWVTERLWLRIPTQADREEIFTLYADQRVWAADPLTRHLNDTQTEQLIDRWRASWDADGLGMWIARDHAGAIVGVGGCFLRRDVAWNLGFRLVPEQWGFGYAQEISRLALALARSVRPELPITGYLLEGNDQSRRTLEALGLTQRWRGPDVGNPDPAAIRILFADRALVDAAVVLALTQN